ncbi:MAG: hypothetical protein GEU83_11845 [Pseudonocardiaceae bacterium]|nr:hypothetical protein [Pseudonocardiaceae bacterium]
MAGPPSFSPRSAPRKVPAQMSNNRNRNRRRNSNGHHAGKAEVVRRAAGADKPFTFHYNGSTYRLPSASDAAEKMPAAHLIDALMGEDPSLAEMRLGIATLQSADVDPEAMAALRAMPMPEFTEIVGRWLRRAGVQAPESERSST